MKESIKQKQPQVEQSIHIEKKLPHILSSIGVFIVFLMIITVGGYFFSQNKGTDDFLQNNEENIVIDDNQLQILGYLNLTVKIPPPQKVYLSGNARYDGIKAEFYDGDFENYYSLQIMAVDPEDVYYKTNDEIVKYIENTDGVIWGHSGVRDVSTHTQRFTAVYNAQSSLLEEYYITFEAWEIDAMPSEEKREKIIKRALIYKYKSSENE